MNNLYTYFTIFFIICCLSVQAQNRFWVGGSGNWSDQSHWSSSSGGASGASVPTSTNNVFIDANSFPDGGNLNLDIDATTNNLDWSDGGTSSLTGSALRTLSISGSMTLSENLTYLFAGQLLFDSNGNQTLNTKGRLIPSLIIFSGNGIWTLQDSLNCQNGIQIDNGNFITNGYKLTTSNFGSNSSSAMNLNLSNSEIELSGNFQAAPNMTISTANSNLFFTGANSEIRDANSLVFNTVEFTNPSGNGRIVSSSNCEFKAIHFLGDGEINGDHTIDTISIDETRTLSLGAFNTQTILDLVAYGGCFDYITIQSTVTGSQANINKVTGNIILEQVNIQDINASGGATFQANNSFDLGNNFGWTINQGRDLYWVGGAGDWDDINRWSLSSGGSPGVCPPTEFDNVYFDINSFTPGSNIVSLTSDVFCHDLDFSAATNNPTVVNGSGFNDFSISGSIFLHPDLDLNNSISMTLSSSFAGEVILSNGFTFESILTINGTGEYTLLDSFNSTNNVSHSNGILNTNGQSFSGVTFTSNNGSVNITNSNVHFGDFICLTNTTLLATDSHIFINDVDGLFRAANSDLNVIEFIGQGGIVGNGNSYDSIIVLGGGIFNMNASDSISYFDIRSSANFQASFVVDTLLLGAGKTYTWANNRFVTVNDSLRAVSSCEEGYIQFFGTSSTTTTERLISGKDLKVIYGRIRYMTGIGNGSPFITENSVDMGGNLGFIFSESPRTLYWVGGGGNWNNPNNWSLSSGGPGGECIPWRIDNVIFDDNSFSSPIDQVLVNGEGFCHDMSWLNTSGTPSLLMASNSDLNIYGSVILSPNMLIPNGGNSSYTFLSSDAETILTNGVSWGRNTDFNGTGSWDFLDAFNTNQLNQTNGTINSNNHNVSTFWVRTMGTINFGTSTWTTTSSFIAQTGSNFDADESILIVGDNMLAGNNHDYNKIFFPNSSTITNSNCTFNLIEFTGAGVLSGSSGSRYGKITFLDNGNINGTGNYIDTLDFSPSKLYQFDIASPADTIEIWNAVSTCAQGYIDIKSTSTSSQAQVYSPNNITLEIVRLENMNALGSGIFTALNSVDNGNNTGWIFNGAPRNLYWVGGTGNWNDAAHWSATSGGLGGECVPTILDDVYFDVNSFTAPGQSFTLNEEANIHSMIWDGVLHFPTWNGSFLGMNIYGSLVFDKDINYNYQNRNINFLSNGIDSLKTDNLPINNRLQFSNNGTFTLIDSLINDDYLYVQDSAYLIATNNYLSNDYLYIQDNATLDMTNSTAQITFTNGTFSVEASANILAIPSTIYLTATTSSISGTGHNFHDVIFEPSSTLSSGGKLTCEGCTFNKVLFDNRAGDILGSNAIDSLILSAGYTYEFGSGKTTTINEYLKAEGDCGNDLFTSISSTSSTIQSTIHTLFPTSVTNSSISGINAAGPNIPFNASGSYDLGNNSNFTFSSSSRNLYWVGGSGDWYQGSHWSLSSGGPGGECPPFSDDNVFFDANSFTAINQNVSTSQIGFCKNMDWSGSGALTPRFTKSRSIEINGSLVLEAGVLLLSSGNFLMNSSNTESIITGGINMLGNMVFQGGGTWNLLDQYQTTSILIIENGTVNTNNNDVTVRLIDMNNNDSSNKTLILGNSVINLEGTSFDAENVNIMAGTSTLRFDPSPSATFRTGINHSFYNIENINPTRTLVLTGDQCSFNESTALGPMNVIGNHTFNKMTFTTGNTYQFGAGDTTTIIDEFLANGTCTEQINFRSTSLSANSFSSIQKSTDSIDISSADINNLHGIGGASFNAFNATGTNAPGWNIVNGDDAILYWVGGTGDWHDQSNWSYSSGGPGGACLPEQTNSVVFDQNSFSTSGLTGETVTINANAECNSMTWTIDVANPIFDGNNLKDLLIYGSLKLSPNMGFNYTGNIFFESLTTGQTITSAGKQIQGNVFFQGVGGGWTLLDDMQVIGEVALRNGSFNTNNQSLTTTALISNNITPRTFILGSSNIYLTGEGDVWQLESSLLSFDAGTSTITLNGDVAAFDPNDNFTFYDLIFQTDSSAIINSDNASFNNVSFLGNGIINGGHSYQDLLFSPGFDYVLESGKTQIILDELLISGTDANFVTITASIAGNRGIFLPTNGPLCLEFLDLKDNEIEGFVYNAKSSIDNGNNENWTFSTGIYFQDMDGDGFGDGSLDPECLPCPTCVTNNLDCDDNNENIFPGSSWTCIGNECEPYLNGLSIASNAIETDTANMEILTPDGWTHYINCNSGRLVLSLNKGSMDIGSIGINGFKVISQTTNGYGIGGEDLSMADYVQTPDWYAIGRYWDIENAETLDNPIKVRFYYDDQDVDDLKNTLLSNGGLNIDSTDFFFYKVSGTGIKPHDLNVLSLNGSFNQYSHNANTSNLSNWKPGNAFALQYGEFEVNGFSGGGLGASSSGGALPLDLLSFKGEIKGTSNLITWSTALELNVSHFELQRSKNGQDFKTIKMISANNIIGLQNYSYNDSSPFEGNNYYRLKIVDYSDTFVWSPIIHLSRRQTKTFQIYPNPVNDKLYLNIEEITNPVEIRILEINGKELMALKGVPDYILVDHLPAGLYLLNIKIENEEINERFIKL